MTKTKKGRPKKQWTPSLMGKKGGAARKRALTKEQRSEIARKAAKTRWDRTKNQIEKSA